MQLGVNAPRATVLKMASVVIKPVVSAAAAPAPQEPVFMNRSIPFAERLPTVCLPENAMPMANAREIVKPKSTIGQHARLRVAARASAQGERATKAGAIPLVRHAPEAPLVAMAVLQEFAPA